MPRLLMPVLAKVLAVEAKTGEWAETPVTVSLGVLTKVLVR